MTALDGLRPNPLSRRQRPGLLRLSRPLAPVLAPLKALLAPAGSGRRFRPFSLLTLRIAAVNILAMLIIMGGLLLFGIYQEAMLRFEQDELRHDARILATLIGQQALTRSTDADSDAPPQIDPAAVRATLAPLIPGLGGRVVITDAAGQPILDSAALEGAPALITVEPLPAPDRNGEAGAGRESLLLRILQGALPRRQVLLPLPPGWMTRTPLPGVTRALKGEESTQAWLDPQRRILLTAAVPIIEVRRVAGTLVLERGGDRVGAAIRTVRGHVLEVSAVALTITLLMSIYLARAIDRPIRQLAAAADEIRRAKTRSVAIPDFTDRGDEIGDLSGALSDMTKALRDRMEAIERFAADVSHEIKNPLASLRSAIDTLGRLKDLNRAGPLLQVIQHDVRRLDRLITDISGFSRLDAELARAPAEPVDLAELLQVLLVTQDLTRSESEDPAAAADKPRLVIEGLEQPDLVVSGIGGRLMQVFENLVGNARSFSPPGGRIWIRIRRRRGRVVTVVEDEGPGIPPGKLEAVFERFYSERPAGESFGQHSGLGLSISKSIVENLGGRIWAENRFDESGGVAGARFTVDLPAAARAVRPS